jgi:hypothetical protein
MKKSVYIETTIVSYLTAWPSRDLIRAARQQLTREWWHKRRCAFRVFASQVVLREARAGDPDAAQQRLAAMEGIPILETTEDAIELGECLVAGGLVPPDEQTDALQIAVATVHRMDVLLTWNCRHMANAEMLGAISRAIRNEGYEPPVICTPHELAGE